MDRTSWCLFWFFNRGVYIYRFTINIKKLEEFSFFLQGLVLFFPLRVSKNLQYLNIKQRFCFCLFIFFCIFFCVNISGVRAVLTKLSNWKENVITPYIIGRWMKGYLSPKIFVLFTRNNAGKYHHLKLRRSFPFVN